ncbi:gliding motility-associated C-terminal domain-containing protein [Pedobacter frigiditerrae]|uniref:Gliding motility-associated C-terminal domain-containing protein n=1 Tax=Pedobacter frigiditerrae TaxID=2530452 RepID=A0A4R0N2N4_9SPHI|nr:gliding motility-associated C-terminal domain-containing protein [Pedobacter frigiditerrae]TCC94020.1 gliding motility-associated C-terminal domain-containing protein [Pedobacter frigiditerrae]
MKRILVFLFLGFSAITLQAATFTVTSNADAGAGTLREAITLANANGTTTKDYIHFNIIGTARTDVSISLENELPILTSNIVIDGTTQVLNLLGNPNIKIALVRAGSTFFSGLRLDNASAVEIYGISFSNFRSDPLGAVDEKKAAIFLYNSKDVIIGAPLKQNCFSNSYAGILSPFVIPRFDNVNIKISSNILGLSEDGMTAQPNESAIDVSFLNNSTIGGDTQVEGNLLGSNTRAGIAVAGATNDIKISYNKIGLNINNSQVISSAARGVMVNGESAMPLIKNNIIVGQLLGLYLDYANGGFKVEGNSIGTGPIGTENYGNTTGIHVRFCNKGVIGGNSTTDGNSIAYNKTGVLIEIAYPISMYKNSFYCNTEAVLFKNLSDPTKIVKARITTITSNKISGTYLPNATVELFYAGSCLDCQGKTWLATVVADANGAWSYNGPITGQVTSMGTNTDGASSSFSKPDIDDAFRRVLPSVCGQANGSITLMRAYDYTSLAWYNSNGDIVGTDLTLINVPAGNYYLKVGQNGGCDIISATYNVPTSAILINETAKKIVDANCTSSNGSIKGITVSNNMPKTWYNAAAQIVSTSNDLLDMPIGNYYFTVGTGSCLVKSATYVIQNGATTYELRDFVITEASCGRPTGSIKITGYSTSTDYTFKWFDSDGKVMGTSLAVSNLFKGNYKLMAYNINTCSNLVGEFIVPEAKMPMINFDSMQKFLSCDGKSVSTTGLSIDGSTSPYTFKWTDENGNIVSDQLNFKGISIGRYQLMVTDKYGCISGTAPIDFTLIKNSALSFANSITPNGDGINDVWEIKGAQSYPDGDFSVFNRNGNRVFYSKGYSKPFDGLNKGNILPVGTYYYIIDLKTDCGNMSGSLTILR